ncbi:MAG: glycosyltransferase [Alphaproteobacteria bacterium]|nr:glycosyltransferase [Alphaproteobacteria bacterium]
MTAAAPPPRLSILVPTRGDPDCLGPFLDSLSKTTADPSGLEVVLCYDRGTERLRPLPVNLRIVETEVAPGQPMGSLNRACYAASSGVFLMLGNDDILVETRDWDVLLMGAMTHFRDGVSLIHVNDGVFKENMCCFPMMSRLAVDIIGEICPAAYRRFAIDDHILDIFARLRKLGENRHLFIEEVVFRHENEAYRGVDDMGNLQVELDPQIAKVDAASFERLAPARHAAAERLFAFIQQMAQQAQ